MSTRSGGFALPTILIASIVMLMVMLVAVQAASSVSVSLQSQYYNKRASEAAESGIAYAKACLAASNNVVTWTGKSLAPNTDCNGNQRSGFSCSNDTTDSRCVLTIDDNIRTSFTVPPPTVDDQGQPTLVTAIGSTDLLRTSSPGKAWRTYHQSAVAAPAVCSPTSVNTEGWNSAVTTTETATPQPTGATPITLATGNLPPGPMFYRKDFIVTQPGAYTLQTLGDDRAEVSIDGQLVATDIYHDMDTSSVTLTAGCHVMVVKVVNYAILPNPSKLMVSLKSTSSSTPLVATDTSWRVTAGDTVQYSSLNYFTDATDWTPVRDMGAYNGGGRWGAGPSAVGTWPSVTGDSTARWISTTHSYDSSDNYPASAVALYKDNREITVAASTQVKVYVAADDNYVLYMDGQQVGSSSAGWSTIVTTTLTLTPGTHKFAIAIGNGSGPSGFLFLAKNASTGQLLSRSDNNWNAAYYWNASNTNPSSYNNNFVPAGIPTYTCPCATITNLATNPDIELNTTNWTGVASTVSRSTTWSSTGAASLLVQTNGGSTDAFASLGGDGGAMRLGLQAGKVYTLTATLKLLSAIPNINSTRAPGIAAFYYAGGYNDAQVTVPNIPGEYKLRLTWMIPSNATEAFLRFYSGTASASSVYWDSIMLTEGPYAYDYRDGNSSGWSWNGMAGSSTSKGPAPEAIP